ncbi:choline dehydrogenase-like flavoprotein [Spirosoma lacussanchae]|uniref:GMC family oxidoreductase n=1 Tax=Spirosoma lacussanchae TaxID=1884249 RepID=UPI00110A03D5|nr:GMC family oxidoreductase [Spirosoma lacussanchae]
MTTTHDIVDAVVIGTGAGGAPLLARLARAGLRVVALEAGRHWNPKLDFATDERAQDKLFWNDERLSAGQDALAFGNNNSGTGVGGSTLHYTAYTPRAQPDDLRIRTEFGVGEDWPIDFADLASYYEEVEQFLGVSGPSPYPWGPTRNRGYALGPLPVNGAGQLMERGCRTLGIRTSPAANAALSVGYYQEGVGHRPGCTNRGFCQAGCTVGAKASMDVTYIPLAIHYGAEVRPECFVTQLVRNASGRISEVVYIRNGQEERQRCHNVFLCAGAIETPRLLLLNGIGNSSGQVGRNLMAHTALQLWGEFDEDIRPYKGIPGAIISEDTHRPTNADFVGGYLLQSIGVMPVTYLSQMARGRGLWGSALKQAASAYNHVAGINILGDCLPYEHNYLELSDETDSRGLPKPRIFFSNGESEERMTAHADQLMRQIWDAAGARNVWTFPRNAHIIGTCRMGNDPDTAVVNADGRSFDIPNLYISDNSTFPSALSVNPALTIMSLALRTADKFLTSQRRTA